MKEEQCLIAQNIAYDLLEEKKYHSAIDVLLLILKEFPQKEIQVLYEGQLVFNYLGFSFMEIGDFENAEKAFELSLKNEEFVGDIYVYLTRINMFLRPVSSFGGRDYKKALAYIRKALALFGNQKYRNINLFSAYNENKVLGIYFETLYFGFKAKELKDIDVEIMSLLRDMMLLNFNEFNIFTHMSYFLRYGFGENDFSEEVNKINFESIEPRVYHDLVHKIVDITYYKEEIKFYYNFSEYRGTAFKELKCNFVTIKEKLDSLKEMEGFTYIYKLVSKYMVKNSIEFYKERCPISKQIYYIAVFSNNRENIGDKELIYKTIHFYKLEKIIEHFFKYNEIYEIDNWITLEENQFKVFKMVKEFILDEIMEGTKKKYNKIILNSENCDIYTSKVGGEPYMPLGVTYPLNTIDGKPLALLAQINFEEMPSLEGFPTKGILQFFIPSNPDLYEIDCGELKIIFHENIKYNCEQQILVKTEKKDRCIFRPLPCRPEYKIYFEEKTRGLLPYDCRFNQLLKENCKRNFGIQIEDIYDLRDILGLDPDEIYDWFPREHCIEGIPIFYEFDPREYDIQDKDKEILLLQLDSDCSKSLENYLWEDGGCINFFISPNDLLNKNFDDVLCEWNPGM
ncbi:YwqG family protein [Fusobacteria bacterium ZRK30]|nr:YwqG family protein [Fusobacteria bacterium ZRK30]